MRKHYILDTNVLLHDPQSMLSFQDNDVIIPIGVIEEIDHFKKQLSELGQSARAVSRQLDTLRQQGRLSEGVLLSHGGTLRVMLQPAHFDELPGLTGESQVDTSILQMASALRRAHPEVPVVVVTKDINLRIKADALNLRAEDYETDRVMLGDLYTGTLEATIASGVLEELAKRRHIPLPQDLPPPVFPNEYITLTDQANPKLTQLGRLNLPGQQVVPLHELAGGLMHIRARNREQYFAFDAMLTESIEVVTLMGKAGTGKTLLAIAAGLHKVLVEKRYKRLLIGRPTMPMGKDIGYLPGSLEEKMHPWMQPVMDCLELLLERGGSIGKYHTVRELMDSDRLALEPLTFIRGRSIPAQFVIIDEAQNLTPLEVKTILTRVGENTKIVFTGDPYQIDNPYVDSATNGFNTIVNKFRAEPLAAHINLVKGERSGLAERAANLL